MLENQCKIESAQPPKILSSSKSNAQNGLSATNFSNLTKAYTCKNSSPKE